MQGKAKEKDAYVERRAPSGDGALWRARLAWLFGEVLWACCAWLFGQAPMLFHTYPLGLALLCASNGHTVSILLGLVASAFWQMREPLIYVCTYVVAAIVRAVDEYQDLLRLSVAHPGNDHRLGGYEAPPAIISMFLGEELDDIVESIVAGRHHADHRAATMNLGIPSVPTFRKDTTDRNRTSPFAFTGNKFEFRSLGSSQNIAMPNVVLNTAVARVLSDMADRLEASEDFDTAVAAVIRDTLAAHKRIIFNGNGYSQEWTAEAARRGLLNLRTTVEACEVLTEQKNIDLFTRFGVLSETEIHARREILLENYAKVLNIEAQTMILMATRQIMPAVEAYIAKLGAAAKAKLDVLGVGAEDNAPLLRATRMERELITRLSDLNTATYDAVEALRRANREALAAAGASDSHLEVARAFRDLVVPAMAALRAPVDEMETLVASEDWPLPTYGEMMHKQ